MTRYGLVFIDADDTLFDFTRCEENALRASFAASGLEFSPAALPSYRAANQRAWSDFERGVLGKDELKLRRFVELFAELRIDADPAAVGAAYIERLSREAVLVAGAEDICRTLRARAILVLATNGIKEVQRGRLGLSPLKDAFDHIVVSEEAGVAKPDPRFFAYGARLADFHDKTRTLVVGDSLASDIKGGQAYGADTCLFDPAGSAGPCFPEPTYRIASLAELAAIVA